MRRPSQGASGALGYPVRLRLLNLLATSTDGAVCVCDLVEPVGKSQPTVSHHLRILREAGLVSVEKRGDEQLVRGGPRAPWRRSDRPCVPEAVHRTCP